MNDDLSIWRIRLKQSLVALMIVYIIKALIM